MEIKTIHIEKFPDGRLDVLNAARYIGLSEKTLANMRCNGNGPSYVKKGKVWYFIEDLDNWLKETKIRSTAQA